MENAVILLIATLAFLTLPVAALFIFEAILSAWRSRGSRQRRSILPVFVLPGGPSVQAVPRGQWIGASVVGAGRFWNTGPALPRNGPSLPIPLQAMVRITEECPILPVIERVGQTVGPPSPYWAT
ncbi:unnamed protein product [Mycena citricolor]|uniref:Uncharacterized protein n=1 Tax=Mycena citricolor TaxID=2018698 RepID=A0AAD2HZZ9_9AGAR|nr:unnamed protein product [Mycena citricolor]